MPHHKMGTSRHQVSFGTLEDQIAPDNPVRIVDAFVDMPAGFSLIKPNCFPICVS